MSKKKQAEGLAFLDVKPAEHSGDVELSETVDLRKKKNADKESSVESNTSLISMLQEIPPARERKQSLKPKKPSATKVSAKPESIPAEPEPDVSPVNRVAAASKRHVRKKARTKTNMPAGERSGRLKTTPIDLSTFGKPSSAIEAHMREQRKQTETGVHKISEFSRDALEQLLDRVGGDLSRDARLIGGRVPPRFQSAHTRVPRPMLVNNKTEASDYKNDDSFLSHIERELEYVKQKYQQRGVSGVSDEESGEDYKEAETDYEKDESDEQDHDASSGDEEVFPEFPIGAFRSIEPEEALFEQVTPHTVSTEAQKPVEDISYAEDPPVVAHQALEGFLPGKNKRKKRGFFARFLGNKLFAVLIGIAIIGTFFYIYEQFQAKENVVRRGSDGYRNLQTARNALHDFDFQEAQSQFAFAAGNFKSVHENVSGLSASLLGLVDIFSNKVESAQALSEAAQLLSEAGENVSETLAQLNAINFFSFLSEEPDTNPIAYLSSLRETLRLADGNLLQAHRLLESVDTGILPEEQRADFDEFTNRIPELRAFIADTIRYSEVLMEILGKEKRMRYVVLFQNTSELRATGGFPGTYAVLEFENGVMEKFFVNDIYNADGHLEKNVIPPYPLQKITPNWGMRDANWFAGFPMSARKVAEFYELIEGEKLDGVLAINSDFILRLLDIAGGVAVPEYGITLTDENFLPAVQNEVEYGPNRQQPKTILYEFAPLFLARLQGLEKDKWVELLAALERAAETKNVLAYFFEPELQKFSAENGFAGQLADPPGDYLMVVFSNIMGSKTDLVIDNDFELRLHKDEAADAIIHELTLVRTHAGGNEQYGFYNKRNPSYVRLYVPFGADLVSIEGNTDYRFNPLIDYRNLNFTEDPDLAFIESNMRTDDRLHVDMFEESGKKVFGFWMITEPQSTERITITYSVPLGLRDDEVSLYLQKQPGATADMNVFYEGQELVDEPFSSDAVLEIKL